MKKVSILNISMLILSLALCLGTKFAFHACAAKPDGSWMHCHQAELAVVVLGGVCTLLALLRFFVGGKGKAALSLAFVPLAVVTALVPGVFVHLCMMKDMRCHAVMRPAVVVLCVLIAAVSLIDALVQFKHVQKK